MHAQLGTSCHTVCQVGANTLIYIASGSKCTYYTFAIHTRCHCRPHDTAATASVVVIKNTHTQSNYFVTGIFTKTREESVAAAGWHHDIFIKVGTCFSNQPGEE